MPGFVQVSVQVYDELKEAAPLFAAVALATFGALQWRINQSNYHIARYKEGITVYRTVKRFIKSFNQHLDIDLTDRNEIVEAIEDADFLLGPKIRDDLKAICEKAESLSVHKKSFPENGTAQERKEHLSRQNELRRQFESLTDSLAERFRRSLKI